MNFKNSTEFPDYLLRRMFSWVCKQVEVPLKEIRDVNFTKTNTYSFKGQQCGRNGLMRIGKVELFPRAYNRKDTGMPLWFEDRIDALVYLTGHEVCHIEQYLRLRGKNIKRYASRESEAQRTGRDVLVTFLKQKEFLMAQWGAVDLRTVKPSAPKPSIQEKRAKVAQESLERWEKEYQRRVKYAKQAQDKMKEWQKKVKYYDKQLSLKAASKGDE